MLRGRLNDGRPARQNSMSSSSVAIRPGPSSTNAIGFSSSSEAGVVASGILDVGVAGAQPFALEDAPARVVARPVAHRGWLAAHEQGAGRPRRHDGPLVV